MIVVVIGATGNLGRQLVRQALERGMSVRAVARRATGEFSDPRVVCIDALADDPRHMTEAFAGADVVVIAFPASLTAPHTYPNQIRTVLMTAKDAGVRRVIGVIGSAGALTASGERLVDTDYFQETTRHFYQSVHVAWDAYRQVTDIDWVAFVPAARMQTHLTDRGQYRTRTDEHLVTVDDTSRRYFDVSQISYGDFAQAILDEIEDPQYVRQFVSVAY